jgi:hypothetical protein
MTFEAIIQEYSKAVIESGFVSKVGGLAQVANVSTAGGNQTIVSAKLFPFESGTYSTISPDKKETGIAFWRASPTRITRQSAYLSEHQNTVTLTVWVNGDKVKLSSDMDAVMYLQKLIAGYSPQIDSNSPYRKVSMEFIGDSLGEVVTGYGWDGLNFKYHEHPHRLFNLQFRFSAFVGAGCATPTFHIVSPVC